MTSGGLCLKRNIRKDMKVGVEYCGLAGAAAALAAMRIIATLKVTETLIFMSDILLTLL